MFAIQKAKLKLGRRASKAYILQIEVKVTVDMFLNTQLNFNQYRHITVTSHTTELQKWGQMGTTQPERKNTEQYKQLCQSSGTLISHVQHTKCYSFRFTSLGLTVPCIGIINDGDPACAAENPGTHSWTPYGTPWSVGSSMRFCSHQEGSCTEYGSSQRPCHCIAQTRWDNEVEKGMH